jgi:DNA polymerase III sliding clamp (beta) subunit (PCNA family)
LEEFLNVVSGDEAVLNFSDPNTAALFLDPKEKDYIHIIMPVRLQA